MTLSRCFLLLLTAPMALGQPARQAEPARPANGPEELVRGFYAQVVARHPTGIPMGADMKIFTPYLSKTLVHKIHLAIACSRDWDRQHPDPDEKPEVAWLESGLFSGQDERTEPSAFLIEKTELEKDGSSRVYVRLTAGAPPDKPWIWRVVAVVVLENGHLVLDDVIFLKDRYVNSDSRLSDVLADGCDGTHWVGFGDKRAGSKTGGRP